MTDNMTTFVCLFHHADQAHAATTELTRVGIPASAISLIHAAPGKDEFSSTSLAEIGVPERDLDHLREGIRGGGVVVSVVASADYVHTVEQTFERNRAKVIDEAGVDNRRSMAAPVVPVVSAAEAAIPIVEEELLIGKRTVDRGGVRLYRRIVEIPVEESVSLRDEQVHVERHPVDRPATDQDLAMQGERSIELTETAEEVVVSKSAHVIEEVHLNQDVKERVETIHDTVRRTEVDLEEIGSDHVPTRHDL
jgi:uncharacterized protein (TIGR02271 family)